MSSGCTVTVLCKRLQYIVKRVVTYLSTSGNADGKPNTSAQVSQDLFI